jgi:hypothetical protein
MKIWIRIKVFFERIGKFVSTNRRNILMSPAEARLHHAVSYVDDVTVSLSFGGLFQEFGDHLRKYWFLGLSCDALFTPKYKLNLLEWSEGKVDSVLN